LANNQYLLAATINKVIFTKHWAGYNTGDTLVEFLSEVLEKIKPEISNDFSFVYFFLDSNKIHEGHKAYHFCQQKGIKILYGVNYYSAYDLCEYFFRVLKEEHYKNVYNSL